MCIIPTWLLFERGRYDLAELDATKPSLAGHHPDSDHPRKLCGEGVRNAAGLRGVRTAAAAGAVADQRPLYVFSSLSPEKR